MSKAELKDMIDLIDEQDTGIILNILLHYIPTDMPEIDEIDAIAQADASIEQYGTIPHSEIDWS